jgi:hypothetical protein
MENVLQVHIWLPYSSPSSPHSPLSSVQGAPVTPASSLRFLHTLSTPGCCSNQKPCSPLPTHHLHVWFASYHFCKLLRHAIQDPSQCLALFRLISFIACLTLVFLHFLLTPFNDMLHDISLPSFNPVLCKQHLVAWHSVKEGTWVE